LLCVVSHRCKPLARPALLMSAEALPLQKPMANDVVELVARGKESGLTPRIDLASGWLYAELAEPMPDRLGGELGSIVGQDVVGRPVPDKQAGQALQYIV
jgi:hypothetical protein